MFGATGRRLRRQLTSLPSTSRRMTTLLLGSGRGEFQRFSYLLLLRYRDNWTPWRGCGNFYTHLVPHNEMFELDNTKEEAVTAVSGYSYDYHGETQSLEASTTAGRNWGPHGYHTPDDGRSSLRNSPNANLRLRFLSGDQTKNNWILR